MFRYLIHCIVTKHLLFSFTKVKLTGFKFFFAVSVFYTFMLQNLVKL